MIDYTHIPLHIRCTLRKEIEPNYPDSDARWWQLQEARARLEINPSRADSSKIPAIVMEWYDTQQDDQHVGLSFRIAGALGVPVKHFYSAMKNYRRSGRKARSTEKPLGFMSPLEVSLDRYLQETA